MLKQIRVILCAIGIIIFTVAATTYQEGVSKVDIKTGEHVVTVNTTAKTVGEVLENSNITLDKEDLVTPAVGSLVSDEMEISISKAFMVKATVDGAPKHLKVNKGTVKNVKEKVEDMIGMGTKLVSGAEADSLYPNMTVQLMTSYIETEEEVVQVPFEELYVDNNQLKEGETKVVTEGVNGESIKVYEVRFESGEPADKSLIETKIVRSPVNKVIEKGTKKPGIMAGGEEREIVKTVTMRASAYTTDNGDSGPITATGERCRVGLVAVDPKYIPLGTWLYIEGYGEARAADTGGMIKGNAIDLFYNTYRETVNFGRRNVTVHILK